MCSIQIIIIIIINNSIFIRIIIKIIAKTTDRILRLFDHNS